MGHCIEAFVCRFFLAGLVIDFENELMSRIVDAQHTRMRDLS